MWKQIGLLVVVFLTLGQAMEFGRPDNIDRTADELELKNKIQTIFTEWQSTAPNVWTDDAILEDPMYAMQFVRRRFAVLGSIAIDVLGRYRGANLDADETYQELIDATIKITVADQKEMDRVISVILKDAKSMLQYSESNRLRFIAEYFPSIHTVRGSLFSIPYSYERVGVPMDKVRRKIEVFEKSLGSNIKPWMRKKLDTMYETIEEKKKIEDSRSPTEKKIFKIISDDNAVPLRELTEPVPLSEPTNPTHRTETTTVWLVFNEIWFPLCFLLGMIIGTILMAKFYFKKEE
eukprot:69818_1